MQSDTIFLHPYRYPLNVQIAQTTTERQQGLQHQDALTPYDGMLFEYPYPSSAAFWMRHVPIDLTIAWFDKSGRLLGAQDVEAHTDEAIAAPGSFSYVLEVPRGSVDFLPDIRLRLNRTRRFVEANPSQEEDDGPMLPGLPS